MIPHEIAAKYEIRGTLGSGAMGTVYDAMDRNIERRVAIKVVRLPPAGDPEGEEAHGRFRREAQAAGRLSHANIVGVHDYGENADAAWIVMELVEGGSLKDRLDRNERFPVPEIARLMEQVLAALAYSHARGVVHRDIKPGNIMLTGDGSVKMADFGIARLENSSMTQVGTVMGTPSYMAPEQLRGETVDARADIWAAGVMLYQLLTGEKPFEGGFSAVMHKALHTEPPPPSQLSVTAPRAFDAVIARALAKRPEDRFATAVAFAEAIRAAALAPAADAGMGGFAGAGRLPGLDSDATILGTTPPPRPAAPPPAASKRRAPAGLIAGSIGALAAAGVAAFFLLGPGDDGRQAEQQTRLAMEREAAEQTATAEVEAERARQAAALRAAQREGEEMRAEQRRAEQLRADLAAAGASLAAMPCSLVAWDATAAGLTVSGMVRRGDDAAVWQQIAARNLPPDAVQRHLRNFDGPYCAALELLRPIVTAPDAAPRAAIAGTLPLAKGELLKLDITTPPWPGHLHVSYLMQSGEVAHLVPSRPEPADAVVRLGEPAGSFPGWEVDEPFGTDLLLVFSSDRPIFAGPRPMVERADDYLDALAVALRGARDQGARVAVRAVVVETVLRR